MRQTLIGILVLPITSSGTSVKLQNLSESLSHDVHKRIIYSLYDSSNKAGF